MPSKCSSLSRGHKTALRVGGVYGAAPRAGDRWTGWVEAACHEAEDGRTPKVMAGHKANVMRSEAAATDLARLSCLTPSVTGLGGGGANGRGRGGAVGKVDGKRG